MKKIVFILSLFALASCASKKPECIPMLQEGNPYLLPIAFDTRPLNDTLISKPTKVTIVKRYSTKR